jgi:hypothetical protein
MTTRKKRTAKTSAVESLMNNDADLLKSLGFYPVSTEGLKRAENF